MYNLISCLKKYNSANTCNFIDIIYIFLNSSPGRFRSDALYEEKEYGEKLLDNSKIGHVQS